MQFNQSCCCFSLVVAKTLPPFSPAPNCSANPTAFFQQIPGSMISAFVVPDSAGRPGRVTRSGTFSRGS